MDQAILVTKADRDVVAQILDALSRTKVPVTLCEWNYVPELDEWQLIIATPWYDSKGPKNTYKALIDALQQAGTYEKIPFRRIYLRSPNDPLVKELERQAKDQKEGFVHILKHADEYSVIFAPVSGKGGAYKMRLFSSEIDLTAFLEEDLKLRPRAVEEAIDEAERTQAGSIYPVTLTTRQIRKLQLE